MCAALDSSIFSDCLGLSFSGDSATDSASSSPSLSPSPSELSFSSEPVAKYDPPSFVPAPEISVTPPTPPPRLAPSILDPSPRAYIPPYRAPAPAPALATMSAVPLQTIIPLPIPRTPEAPSFDGTHLSDFLSILKQHGHRAGLSEDELVPYILQYCTEDVKKVLRFSPELKATASSWTDAVEEMKVYYSSDDKPTFYSVDDLRQFCQETRAQPAFQKPVDAEQYLRRFREISGSISSDNRLPDSHINLYFVSGLPQDTLDAVFQKLPASQRVVSNPPSMKEVRKILNGLLNEDSLRNYARTAFGDLEAAVPCQCRRQFALNQ